jgi:hypothetical protein
MTGGRSGGLIETQQPLDMRFRGTFVLLLLDQLDSA